MVFTAEMLALFIPHALFALSMHEASHAYLAYVMGDDTAAMLGRVTLNPVRHVDLFGALAFLLIGFGWAKPVPVNPLRLKNPRRDDIIISGAGPISNLVLGLLFLLVIRAIMLSADLDNESARMAVIVLFVGAQLNVGLAFFNLIPVPPLDGSHILMAILPESVSATLEPLMQNGWIVLLLFIFGAPYLLGFSLLGVLIGAPMGFVMDLVLGAEGLSKVAEISTHYLIF